MDADEAATASDYVDKKHIVVAMYPFVAERCPKV